MATHASAYQHYFGFGKYKGRSLGEIYHVDRSYLEWVVNTVAMPKTLRENCQLVLDEKPLPTPPMVNPGVPPKAAVKGELFVAKKKIGIRFPYDEAVKNRLKIEIDGMKWNAEEKHWEVPIPQLIRLVNFFGRENLIIDDEVKKLYIKEHHRRIELDAIRAKEDTDIEVPTLLPPFPYQKVGIEFIIRANGRALVADQPGLGKTFQALGFAAVKGLKTLIICPKSVKLNWAKEIRKFLGKNPCLWDGQGVEEGHKNASFHIVNYDVVAKHAAEFRKMGFDLLVCDEATYLKNYKSERTKVIFGNWKARKRYPGIKTKYAILLTGTPVLNRVSEYFGLLSFLDKERFNNPAHFKLRYGNDEDGKPRNLDELYDRTKDLVIRRLKSQVANELPPKQRFELLIEMTKAEEKAYVKALGELFKAWKLNGRPSAAHMPGIRNLLFQYKLPRIIEFIDEMLAAERPMLIFTIHQAHAYKIKELYGNICGVITGNESTKERQAVIEGVKEGKIKVAVFTINAGGMGIDGLQEKMDAVVFVDTWFVPAQHEQAEDRTHRTGQKGQVQIWYMKVVGTYDEVMLDILREKQEIIDKAVDGLLVDRTMNQNFFKEFVKKLATTYRQNISTDDVYEDEL